MTKMAQSSQSYGHFTFVARPRPILGQPGPRARQGPDFVNWPYLGLDEELSAQSVHFYKVFGGPGSPGHELEPL